MMESQFSVNLSFQDEKGHLKQFSEGFIDLLTLILKIMVWLKLYMSVYNTFCPPVVHGPGPWSRSTEMLI